LKKSAVTDCPKSCSGSPLPVSTGVHDDMAAANSSERMSRRRSANVAYPTVDELP
jgi:hypothetical protein